jgi:hypothetical protein
MLGIRRASCQACSTTPTPTYCRDISTTVNMARSLHTGLRGCGDSKLTRQRPNGHMTVTRPRELPRSTRMQSGRAEPDCALIGTATTDTEGLSGFGVLATGCRPWLCAISLDCTRGNDLHTPQLRLEMWEGPLPDNQSHRTEAQRHEALLAERDLDALAEHRVVQLQLAGLEARRRHVPDHLAADGVAGVDVLEEGLRLRQSERGLG